MLGVYDKYDDTKPYIAEQSTVLPTTQQTVAEVRNGSKNTEQETTQAHDSAASQDKHLSQMLGENSQGKVLANTLPPTPERMSSGNEGMA